jgi:hypothetical protein
MAEIKYSDLLVLLKQCPNYKDLCMGVDAETSLYIRFATPKQIPVESETMTLADGSQLVIDREKDGTVVGLEIV